MLSLTKWDGAEYLEDEEMIAELLRLAMARGNKEHLVNCLDCAMRARNINRLAEETGIDRKKIFEMLSEAKGAKTTLIKVAKAFVSDLATQAVSYSSSTAKR
jgi:probable addiction module antidote protein